MHWHAENPFAPPKDLDIFCKKFDDWLAKIICLLNHHQLQLVDTKLQIWVLMNAKGSGKVHATLFEMIGTVEDIIGKTDNINK